MEEQLVIASGNAVTVVDPESFKAVKTVSLFQKPITSLHYDPKRNRLVAGGMDNQLKFYSTEFTLEHKIKVQSAIGRFAMSADGQHYGLALGDGAVIIRSR